MSSTPSQSVTVIGAGNIGSAVAGIALKAGAAVQVLTRDPEQAASIAGATPGAVGDAITGDIVLLALPYGALDDVLAAYPDGFAGRIVVDPTNPVDFGTLDSLLPAGSSAAAQLAERLPRAKVLKAFNTNFSATLASGVTGGAPTAVLIAGDDAEAKQALSALLAAAGLRGLDAGPLKRAHELEGAGALQIGLAVTGQTPWDGGFAVVEA
ncbi:MAG: diguanylate cyclase [Micrococcales bacterium 73-13]|nr:MAG: diguanylate cyclase [Micrococcales bacterium 73-13]